MESTPKVIDSNILNRKSHFSFSQKPVEEEHLLLVFEAARLAPSSYNAQPWRYVYVEKNDEDYLRLLSLLAEANKVWASSAPILILSFAQVFDVKNNRANRFAFHDLGLSTSNLMAQATSLGLATHPMGGYDVERAKEVFRIPEGFEPGAMIAMGYPGDPTTLPEDLQKRNFAPRMRKDHSEIVFKGGWEKK